MELTKENLIDFQTKLNELNRLKLDLKEKREVFDTENSGLIEQIDKYFAETETMREDIREEALVDFKETGEKKLLGGLGIRQGTFLEYDDKLAFDWAKEHELALSFDKRRFEQLAKTEKMNFVKEEEKITVTFPKEIKLN